MMYGNDAPIEYRPRQLEQVDACPATQGPISKLQRAALERWLAVSHALESVLVAGTDPAQAVTENTEWLDDLQTDIVADLVDTGIALLESSDINYDFAPDPSDTTVDNDTNLRLIANIGITAEHADGTVEHIKLRTGRRPTQPSEAAILLAHPDTEPGHVFSDAMLAYGSIEPIELTDEAITNELDRLFAIAQTSPNQRDRRPGRECYICPRIARCGQYPPEPGIQIGRWQRTILLTKTELLRLNQCHRRIAWKRLYAIPKDDLDEDNAGALRGTRFHDLLASTLIAEDPDLEFRHQLTLIDAMHHEDMSGLYERHKTIEATHTPIIYRFTEYQVGATLTASGIETNRDGDLTPGRPIAVTIIARTDAVGREPDGTPAVVEHRTGTNSDRIDERETALYALSVARLLKTDTVAIHQHALDAEGGPRCERIVYTTDTLAQTAELLTQAIEPIVNWHPNDALKPQATPGQWCTGCDFRTRCPVAQ